MYLKENFLTEISFIFSLFGLKKIQFEFVKLLYFSNSNFSKGLNFGRIFGPYKIESNILTIHFLSLFLLTFQEITKKTRVKKWK